MTFIKALAFFTAIIMSLTAVRANLPIIVAGPAHLRTAVRLCGKASDQLRNGDIADAKQNVDAALRIDPKLWPALFVRAQIYRSEGKYELAKLDRTRKPEVL
jgi:Tfp pilus assembly protein PilF